MEKALTILIGLKESYKLNKEASFLLGVPYSYANEENKVNEAIAELEEEDKKIGEMLIERNNLYIKIAELEEAMKPKCEQCDNNHKDRTVFYDGKKILLCTLCKYNAVSYFKPKDNA